MAGRISDDDIALVRERARIDDVVSRVVALRNAGGGSLKGLCPFHDEKTPSFTVTPARGFYYCFGCGEGGDVITFVQRYENLGFTEAVQVLADRVGVVLKVVETDGPAQPPGLRKTILEANSLAQDFFIDQLASPEAIAARQFLDSRGFDRAAALHFGIGYAPRGGRALATHLRNAGLDSKTLTTAGLVRESGRDFFVGRVLWPIRDSAQSVLGFGARRIYDDDRLPAKYINTPETPVYKKSHVLYGLDLARKAIGQRSQVVVVEGYTDVMAAHLSGIETAVASCGTAFGDDHARLVQRLMGSHDGLHGEVIFTFDGDAAGQKAALKVFSGDQNFVSQTYVAVEPNGLDPCDLLIKEGPAAVRELVARRVPLYQFVMRNVLRGYDLDRAEGRLGAAREAGGLLSAIRDQSLVNQYLRELAALLGMDIDEVRTEVAGRSGRPASNAGPAKPTSPNAGPTKSATSDPAWPNPDDPALRLERDTLKLMLQQPEVFDTSWNQILESDFSHPGYRAVFRLISQVDLADAWSEKLRAAAPNDLVRQLLISLLVEPTFREPDESYAYEHSARLRLASLGRQIADLKSRLQRTDPIRDEASHRDQFAQLTELEKSRRELLAATIS